MNNKTTQIIIAIVLIGVSFYGGMKYKSSKMPSLTNDTRNINFAGRGGVGRGGNGSTFGEILTLDTNGITVKSADGSSKIVLISPSTLISKQVSGIQADLIIGKSVSVNGALNPDGSITAQMIQLRPASTTTPRQN